MLDLWALAIAVLCCIVSSVLLAFLALRWYLRGRRVPQTLSPSGRLCGICARPALPHRTATGQWRCADHKSLGDAA